MYEWQVELLAAKIASESLSVTISELRVIGGTGLRGVHECVYPPPSTHSLSHTDMRDRRPLPSNRFVCVLTRTRKSNYINSESQSDEGAV